MGGGDSVQIVRLRVYFPIFFAFATSRKIDGEINEFSLIYSPGKCRRRSPIVGEARGGGPCYYVLGIFLFQRESGISEYYCISREKSFVKTPHAFCADVALFSFRFIALIRRTEKSRHAISAWRHHRRATAPHLKPFIPPQSHIVKISLVWF